MKLLTVFYDQTFLKHGSGQFHPESPARLKPVIEACESFSDIDIIRECRRAERDEIELVHTREYFDYIESVPGESVMLDPDTYFGPDSFEVSLKAAGAVIEAVRYVSEGDKRRAFCAVRPPGHHAEAGKAMGFCIFNNIAIGAAFALTSNLAERVAIIDWDVHHGNGTQNMFYDNPDVLYISLHQYPYYPGSGSENETGDGDGDGSNLNIPMRQGANDEQYKIAFQEKVLPAIENYRPDLLMVSAGFDAHRDDPLAGVDLSTEMFGIMTRMLVDQAVKHCRGRIVSVLEGGYNPDVLRDSMKIHLKELLNG
ncbi:MAG: histone deacetylase [candidate division Zixibacteria bacterium]|nr:histone deacetylase [candidate division Zixibacteria bacterium]